MNDIPRRKYNRVLFSSPIKLPPGTPGEGSENLEFIANLGRMASWPSDRYGIVGEQDDRAAEITLEWDDALEEYQRTYPKDAPQSSELRRATMGLNRLKSKLEYESHQNQLAINRAAAAYMYDSVSSDPPADPLPQGDKPDTWKFLDSAIVAWLVTPSVVVEVLRELTDPLSQMPSMPQSVLSQAQNNLSAIEQMEAEEMVEAGEGLSLTSQ